MFRMFKISKPVLAGWTALFALALLLAPGETFAKLSKAQIDSLQNEAKLQGWTFQVSQNPATQYDLDQLCGLKEPANWRQGAPFDDSRSPQAAALALPSSFDWRNQISGGMPPIKNQAQCGSCWAFSTTGAFECAIKIKDGINVDLSEQWLVSCNIHAYSCSGGWWVHDMEYNTADKCGGVGAVLEVNDPYKAADIACSCPYPHDYKLDGWSYIGGQWGYPTVTQIKQAIMDHGPVSVAIAVDNAFQAYSGGILSSCGAASINHAVVIVGWDDNQGPSGVWIMRNSWGQYWGEGGYMRIPYNCDQIGYNATYVNYRGRVAITADTVLGTAPLTVSFGVQTALAPTTYAWRFGDGGTSTVVAPVHTYTTPGLYTVGVDLQCADGVHTATSNNLVAAFADTLGISKASGKPGQTVTVDVYARNYLPLAQIDLPICWAGTSGLIVDSASTVGLRTAGLLDTGWNYYDKDYSQSGYYHIAPSAAQQAIDPGNGPVLHLYCHIVDGGSGGSSPIVIQPVRAGFSTINPAFKSLGGTYVPFLYSGQVTYCDPGDVNSDGHCNLADLSALVSNLTGGSFIVNSGNNANANVNGRGIVDLADLSYFVAFLTGTGPAPVCP